MLIRGPKYVQAIRVYIIVEQIQMYATFYKLNKGSLTGVVL